MSTYPTIARLLAQSGLVPLDARVLLAHVLSKDRAWLVAHGDDAPTRGQAEAFLSLAHRRREGEPVAYLTGMREFWGLPLCVSTAVLIPRPETETLVEFALERLPVDRDVRVLDLGTGSGAIALAIAHERPRARILAVDVSQAALLVACENARRLNIANVEFAWSDWYEGVASSEGGEPFDLVVSNPPYVAANDPHLRGDDVRFEPPLALASGSDGLSAIRRIVAGARAYLFQGGTLAVEHGYDQPEAVRALFAAEGFAGLVGLRDLAGIPRVVAGVPASTR